MFCILSPAKKMADAPRSDVATTVPDHAEKTAILLERLRTYDHLDLMALMRISERLAMENVRRFTVASRGAADRFAALFLFAGDVYTAMHASDFSQDDCTFAAQHVGILSGLYGLLRPFDAIVPYRLEMGTKLSTDTSPDLYAFWRQAVTETLASRAHTCVINLASQEYVRVIDRTQLSIPVIDIVFQEIDAHGRGKTIGLLAKRARGMMVRSIVENRITEVDSLKTCRVGNYAFDEERSTVTKWFFTRPRHLA